MTTFTSEDREAAAMSMSALELADGVKEFYSHPNQPYFLTQLENMLRQQQAEIQALKKGCFAFQNAAIDLAKKCKDSYDTVCKPSVCDCNGLGEKND